MVRLKVEYASEIRDNDSYFNSTMVRLKASSTLHVIRVLPNFNSTMVRLKARSRTAFQQHKTFQFHYGTIKSILASKSP